MKGINIMYGYWGKVTGMIMTGIMLVLLLIQKATHFAVLPKFNSEQHFNFLLWLTIFGLVLIAFSKEKHEDERVHRIRTHSFMMAFFMLLSPTLAFALVVTIMPNSADMANGTTLTAQDIIEAGRFLMYYPAVGLVLHLVMFHVGLHFDENWNYENESWSLRGIWKHKKIILLTISTGIIIIYLIFQLIV